MKKTICAILLVVALAGIMSGCTASIDREMKSISSEWSGGLNRTLTLYDYNGEEVQSWKGKMDVTNEENRTMFDMGGKRTIIRGGIVVIQED